MLNTGPHSCIRGGGLQLSSAGTVVTLHARYNNIVNLALVYRRALNLVWCDVFTCAACVKACILIQRCRFFVFYRPIVQCCHAWQPVIYVWFYRSGVLTTK